MALTVSSLLITCLVFVASVYILIYYLKKLRLYRESARFPGPPSYPIIGNAHYFLGCSTEGFISKCQEILDAYPSPFRFWLGGKLVYVVYDPEQLKTVFNSPKAIEKDDVYKFVEPCVGTGLFSAPAWKWRKHRKLIMPTFNPRILKSFVEVFSAQSDILVKQMEAEINGNEFDIFHYISLCTLDILCETAMGIPSRVQTERISPFLEACKGLSEIVYSRMFKIWLYPDIIFNCTKLGKEQRDYIKFIHKLTNDVIQRKKRNFKLRGSQEESNDENDGKRKAFLDLLMELSHEGTKFTDEELRDEVDTMMVAGNDTTASINCFVVLMLATFPEVQEKVYEELCEIYGSENPSSQPVRHEDLQRMQYLELVINETMRLFPIGPMIMRRITDDLNIGKFTLTKGSSVLIGIIKTHRSAEYWKDPLKFIPERFLPEECAKRHPYAYIPFSAGPRNCLGMKYAMMSMKVLLATMVRKYVLKVDKIQPIEDIKIKVDIMLKPSEPIKIRINKRVHTI